MYPYLIVNRKRVIFSIMVHSDDYVPFFMALFNVAVGLSGLFHRVASIDERFYLPGFNELFDGV